MKLTRRSFFGFAAGAAATVAVTPKALVSGRALQMKHGPTVGKVIHARISEGGQNHFVTPEVFAKEFLKLLKENMIIGGPINGKDG